MSIQIPLDRRNIIPRWRYSNLALDTTELVIPIRDAVMSRILPDDIQAKIRKCSISPSIALAADIVASCFSQGFYKEASELAEYLLANEKDVAPAVVTLSNMLLVRAGKRAAVENQNLYDGDITKTYLMIRNYKKALNIYPKNSIMWVDLARSYLLLGQLLQSTEAMKMALALSPANRFVLRSAARLFVHLGEPDRAHDLLIRQDITRKDPWLLAAEIAIANVAETMPKFYKLSRELIFSGTHQPYHSAELTSAVATMELASGANKRAKKLFESSLVSPTENTVAQSAWAKRILPTLDLGTSLSSVPRTYEARALSSYLRLDWQGVVQSSIDWFLDEPYSGRPAILGSFAASIGLGDYLLAEKIAKNALMSNPGDHTLINNYAFSLANSNKLPEALRELQSLKRPAPHTSAEIALLATEGMICIRSGDVLRGQQLYHDAISLATRESLPDVAALASVYYARESFLVGSLTKELAIQFIDKATSKISRPDIHWIVEKTKKTINEIVP